MHADGYMYIDKYTYWSEYMRRGKHTKVILKGTTLILCMAWMQIQWCEINVSYLGGLWDSTVQVSLHSDQYNVNSDASKMENVGDVPSKSDVGVIMYFLHLEGVPSNDIHRRLCNVFEEGT